MGRYVEEALDAGAIGVSSGLIYAPGIHAAPDEVAALVAVAARHGALTPPTCATSRRASSARSTRRSRRPGPRGDLAARPARLQVSHLKAGAHAVWGTADALVERIETARRDGLDAAADQYPYTAAATTLSTILPPSILALSIADAEAAIRDEDSRATIRDLMLHGVSGWENVSLDPGWAGIVISRIRVAAGVGRALGPGHRRRARRRPG